MSKEIRNPKSAILQGGGILTNSATVRNHYLTYAPSTGPVVEGARLSPYNHTGNVPPSLSCRFRNSDFRISLLCAGIRISSFCPFVVRHLGSRLCSPARFSAVKF